MPEDTATATAEQVTGAPPKVKWNDAGMKTAYANVCHVASTREEVTLLFGTNQTGLGDRDVTVSLSDRIILSPYAAKRLAMAINNVMTEYERRWGSLTIETQAAAK